MQIKTDMTGMIVELLVKAGDTVEPGQDVAYMEVMKMQFSVTAPVKGTITKVYVRVGDFSQDGDDIYEFLPG